MGLASPLGRSVFGEAFDSAEIRRSELGAIDLGAGEIGIGQQRHFDDNRTIYDNVLHKKHHDHLICNKCEKIIEFESPAIERLQEEMAARHGFTLSNHRLELYGHCIDWKNCRDWRKTAGR